MNHDQWRQVERHGRALLYAFRGAVEKDPVLLCKDLRRVENRITPTLVRNCNEGVPEEELDKATNRTVVYVMGILGISKRRAKEIGLFVNRDPRGYALKLDSEWTRDHNNSLYPRKLGQYAIHTDMGGYGILAPDYSNYK